ncbi:hypothetical protein LSTR_LSTR007496 [Laodelphax striatellus]|uniref:BESS domain-containing protein n=1 Tax=Laodelphax striatellus TaxID=195883 RepID=A0A482X4G2_LAOST|nr:hypothetical protein LSTR_LSTR007496 [Laodelphax striatellus]
MSAAVRGSNKWSPEHIEVFLECFENHELLWNVRHSYYTNKVKRESAIVKLRSELIERGLQVPDLNFLRARIKSIKETYKNEALKIRESIKMSEGGTVDVYVPKLGWFNSADRFLHTVVFSRAPKSNLGTLSTIDENRVHIDVSGNQNPSIMEDEFLTEEATGVDPLSHPNPTLRKRHSMRLTRVEQAVEKLQNITKNCSSEQMDEMDVFGKYVAAQLRDLPLKNRLKFQSKIQTMLMKERLSLLRSTSSPFSRRRFSTESLVSLSTDSSVNGHDSSS